MPYWIRFIRPWRKLQPNEVQAKIPMLQEPAALGSATSKRKAWGMVPVRDPDVYPLLVCVATAVAMFAFYNVRNFITNPDLSLSKTRRETPTTERAYDPTQLHAFTKHRAHMATLRANAVNADPAFEPCSSDAMATKDAE